MQIVAYITAIVVALTGLVKVINYFIKESTLLADTIWDLKKYGFKRRKKDGKSPIVDS